MRCGEKLPHNYLVAIFTIINEERKRVIVCLKCKEILNKKVIIALNSKTKVIIAGNSKKV